MDSARLLYQEHGPRFKGDNDADQMAAQLAFFARNYREAEYLYSELEKRDSQGGTSYDTEISYGSVLGRICQALGDAANSQAILEQSRVQELAALKISPNSPTILYRLAAIHSSLGESEIAFERLHAAVNNGWIDYRTLRLDPRFDSIAEDSRFQQIVASLSTKLATLRRQTDQPTKMVSNGGNNSP